MKRRYWIGVGAVLALAVAWWSFRASGREAIDWIEVERDDLILTVDVAGTLKAVDTTLVGPPQLPEMWQFKISQIAPEGDEVAAGTPVISFDASELQQRLQREIAERDAARKRVEKAEKELLVRQQQDELRLAEAEARLRKAELQAASPEYLEAARDLALVRLDLELARKEVAYLRERIESSARSSEAALAALRDQLRRAEQNVEQTEADIAQMTVPAERDGTVIYVTDWNDQKKKIGDTCWKGEHVIELPDLDRMQAMGMVYEADAGRVAVGQPVSLRLDAHPEVEFTGSVASIWRTVQRESWRTPKKVVRLEIELDETDTSRMRPGMRYRGKIEVERVGEALLVDADAVFLEPEGPVVFRRTVTGFETVPVELGRRNSRRVEVLGGLSEGDRVTLTDPRAERRTT
jgi:multidrug efflux pump subunit AcrA (membrane-fusion protein)